jgi:NADH:ubiquinone oxidoreductase subunit H
MISYEVSIGFIVITVVLCVWGFLLSEALKQKIINSSVLDDLKKWRKSPENWNN